MPQKIYLADDEKNIRDLIAAFLSQEGFEVKTFESGDALLAACDTALPDLVILDIMMPGTDGLSVCSTLRKASADLPIIIVSAKDSPCSHKSRIYRARFNSPAEAEWELKT